MRSEQLSAGIVMGTRYEYLTVYQAVRRTLRGQRVRLGLLRGLSLACAVGLNVSPANAELPQICVSCANGAVTSFVSNGAATLVSSGNSMTINQTTNSATLNWQSFNISGDSSVRFVQPSSNAVALNRIYQNSASQIFGRLDANGRVYLLNQNGIVFGNGAQVNVAGLIASSLNISNTALNTDGSTNLLNAGLQSSAAFQLFTDVSGNVLSSGDVQVIQGANITTSNGGQVLMFAPNVSNQGLITTPGGQTMLAAGTSIYLAESSDANLRGLLVEVGSDGMTTSGAVTNGISTNAAATDVSQLVGQIVAERGNVTLAGLAVNQLGRVTATTSISENGSIRLQARAGGSAAALSDGSRVILSASEGGALTVGQRSTTEVALANDASTTVDNNEQSRSQIKLSGQNILVLEDAQLTAKSGVIEAVARANPGDGNSVINGIVDDGSRIYVASGAVLDVSGADVAKSMESNVIRVELRGDELADSPLQRDGALRGEVAYVDIRQGTTLADVSGQISLIERGVVERNMLGGDIKLESQGDVILAPDSTLDISGGSVAYADGYINTSKLLGADGRIYDIADADPTRVYTGLTSASTITVTDARWGVTKTYSGGTGGKFEAGYVEGKDAGAVTIVAPKAIVDGDINATTRAGRYQRQLATDLLAGQTYRTYNELPLGGQLTFGLKPGSGSLDRVGGDVLFSDALVMPSLANADGSRFNPEQDALPSSIVNTTLRSELFGDDRIQRVEIQANGSVTLSQDVSLQLAGQGALDISAAQIELAGDVIAPSGSITVTALPTRGQSTGVSINVTDTALLDVSGGWVNDSLFLNAGAQQLAPLLIDGGQVTLDAILGSLMLEQGSVIDVSGGAWAQRDGSVSPGAAGAIDLSTTALQGQSVVLSLGAELRGYGFDTGGALSISASEICIAADGGCATDVESTLQLTPQALVAGGFSDITLESNERGLRVESGTDIRLQQRNRQLIERALSLATGAQLDDVSLLTMLPGDLRAATNLTLNASVANLASGAAYTNASFAAVPSLVIESGAGIHADPGASVSLQTNTSMLVDGQITARGGDINLTLDNSLSIAESLDTQGIWLDSNARLDVSGITLLEPNEFNLRTGDVLDGGSIDILAERGVVIANAGSQLDISGTSATLDIRNAAGATISTASQLIASDGGVLNITAADAIVLSGAIDAHAGAGSSTAAGGELGLTLDANQRGASQQLILPTNTRRVVVTQTSSPLSVAPGVALPTSFRDQASIAADDIAEAGFSSVTLAATTTDAFSVFGSEPPALGDVEFDGDVNLNVGRQLVLDAARITGNGQVDLGASYIALGHTDKAHQDLSSPTVASGGSLTVSAALIELQGNSTIDGFDDVGLHSSGDIRLRGIQAIGATTLQGSLQTSADLTLQADQVYATTLSNFNVSVANNTDGVLRVESTGEARDVVLSAASHLTLNAPTIEQAGALRAPFGSIELNAETLTLQAGSLTSTSAEGAIIPFGELQAGKDWIYRLDGQTLLVGDSIEIPEQNVTLNGDAISVASGAVIDVSAGGDLLGYEFISGTGGTVDVLSAANSPTRFAIVPRLGLTYAAHDAQESAGTRLSVGDSIHISGGVNGLPEGDYALLPARYALLEGAYLVEVANGYTDLQPGEVLQQLNGSTVVSGYMKVANTNYADARTSGILVTPGSVYSKQAQYNTTLASTFFSEQATANNTALPRLSQDAGVVSIAAVSQLNIDGQLRAAALPEGRGAAVDISAANLVISDTAIAASNEVVVSANDLNALGAESVLLGGTRRSTDAGVAIDVAATTVTVAGDAVLTAPELLLAATDTVRVADSADLTASGEVQATDTYLLNGDSALLRLAAGEQAEIRRANETGATGNLILEQGATLTAAGGALALDASLDVQSDATLAIAGGSLSLGASRINLAETGVTAAGLTLDVQQLSNLNLDQLVLVSRSSIDLYGDVALDVNELQLDAAGLRNQQAGGDASITARDNIILGNRADRTESVAGTGSGTLQLIADNIVISDDKPRSGAEFTPVTFGISGYNEVALIAATQVRGETAGELAVQGNLTISAPVLLADRGADTTISATGALRVVTANSVAIAQQAALGGSLALSGATVDVGSRVEAAAGKVSITADSGDVTLLNGGVIDVAGRSRDFAVTVVAAPAGAVTLTSLQGDMVAQSGSVIDLSAEADGDAGRLVIKAVSGAVSLNGELHAEAQQADNSGSVSIDASSLGSFSTLNAALNTAGFNAERHLRQRGAGDLVLNSGSTLTAQDVRVTADQGSIAINGVLDASGAAGGEVVLSALNDVNVNGSILANATTAAGDGGELDLRADSGAVRIASGALVNLSAGGNSDAGGGELNLRVERQLLAATLADTDISNDAVVLAGTLTGVSQTMLEAYQRYDDAALANIGVNGGVITAAHTAASETNRLWNDANMFITTSAADITTALGRTGDDSFRLLAGIELATTGDLTLSADWNLFNWRFGEAPGVLTLRAGGDLTFSRSLSDGFNGITGSNATAEAYVLPATVGDSWSYRLVAGADSNSVDLLAVGSDINADVIITAGTVPTTGVPTGGPPTSPNSYRIVRTGNGSIDVAASGSFVLGNQASVLYTAGVASSDGYRIVGVTALTDNPNGRAYPVAGGDISIDVGGDIRGAQTTQLYTDWLWRTGQSAVTAPDGYATAWTMNFARFMQNIGALGGGDVNISAAGDISDLSVSIPSIGKQVGGARARASVVEVVSGGDLSVDAGGDILGGNYLVGLGRGNLSADGSLDVSANTDLYPILGLGDGEWVVQAGRDVGIETVINPTLVTKTASQPSAQQTFFSSYGTVSVVHMVATAGDVLLSNNVEGITNSATSIAWDGDAALSFYPPSLQAVSLSGDVLLNDTAILFPASDAAVQLLADRDIRTASPEAGFEFRVSDADYALLPTIENPSGVVDGGAYLIAMEQILVGSHASTPVHAGDGDVAEVVARTGDVNLTRSYAVGQSDSSILSISMPTRIIAGGDIIDLPLTVQHDDAADVSSIVAGGDIRYTIARNENGAILRNSREIAVDGPGALLISAGGDVDLQTSSGISSRGNLVNTNLVDGGANINVLAGVNGRTPNYAAFEQQYLIDTDSHAALLDAYVAQLTGVPVDTHEQALALFAGLSQQQKAPLLQKILLSELRLSAIEAASSDPETNGDYSRGFTAMNTMFPDADSYSGDIALYFSRIYTQAGGDITLLTPGGGINAGLATPPTSFGITKGAAELGIVSQRGGAIGLVMDRDLQVNESRVFAINNSDIMVWSSNGDIDAGRGAKTAISAPEAIINYDQDGRAIVTFSAALAGSGIQTRATTSEFEAGDVVLAAPRGVVNAGDAGIVAGNLTIAATAVLGADNIKVGGVAVGVPVDTGGLGASLTGVSAAASGASNSATMSAGDDAESSKQQSAPLAQEAISWLEVFVVGLGEEGCRQDDLECLKRQK